VLITRFLFSYEYIVNNKAGLEPIPGNTQITTLTGGNWDDGYYDLTLPTSDRFYFYGKWVTHVRIWTNGYVTFGFGSAPTDYTDYTPDSIPSPDNPNGYVAPWWDDWDLTTRGSIWYVLSGTYLNIQWKDIPHKDDSTASYDFKLLIGFSDNSSYPNEFIFFYEDVDSGSGAHDAGKTGTIGIEHYTGYQAEKYSHYEQRIENEMSIRFTPYVPIYGMTDGWGDGKPDPVVYRVSNHQGIFFMLKK